MSVFCFLLMFLSLADGKTTGDDKCCNYNLVAQCKSPKEHNVCENAKPQFPDFLGGRTEQKCKEAYDVHATARICVRGIFGQVQWPKELSMKEKSVLQLESVHNFIHTEHNNVFTIGEGASFRIKSMNLFEQAENIAIGDYATLHVQSQTKEGEGEGYLKIYGKVEVAERALVELEVTYGAIAEIDILEAGASSIISIHGLMSLSGAPKHGSQLDNVHVGAYSRLEMYGEPFACDSKDLHVGQMASVFIENYKTGVKLYLRSITVSDTATLKVIVSDTNANELINYRTERVAKVGPLTISNHTHCTITINSTYDPTEHNQALKAGDQGDGYHCEEYIQYTRAGSSCWGWATELQKEKKRHETLLEEKTKRIEDLVAKLNATSEEKQSISEILKEKEKSLKEKEKSLNEKEKSLNEKEKSLKEKEKNLNEKEESLNKNQKSLETTKQSLKQKENSLVETKQSLNETEKRLNETAQALADEKKSNKKGKVATVALGVSVALLLVADGVAAVAYFYTKRKSEQQATTYTATTRTDATRTAAIRTVDTVALRTA